MERREHDVVLVPEASGGFSVFVPDLPSVATEGETIEEALETARDAIEGCLEIMRAEGRLVRHGLATPARVGDVGVDPHLL